MPEGSNSSEDRDGEEGEKTESETLVRKSAEDPERQKDKNNVR
jgi:hypothetical protein